jgi:hypothetical protein
MTVARAPGSLPRTLDRSTAGQRLAGGSLTPSYWHGKQKRRHRSNRVESVQVNSLSGRQPFSG